MKKSFKLLLITGILPALLLTNCGQKNNEGDHTMNGTHEEAGNNGNPDDATAGNSASMDVDSTKAYGTGQ